MLDSFSYAAMCHGYKELTSANITVENGNPYGEMPDGKKILLYDGKSWRLDDVGKQMVIQMGTQMEAAPPYWGWAAQRMKFLGKRKNIKKEEKRLEILWKIEQIMLYLPPE